MAVRIWPAPEYSRVTIESDNALSAKQFFIGTPPRLAVDIEGIDLNPALRELVAKVKHDDPNIAGIRVGQNVPGVVRLVIDLKQEALPQVFTLAPVAAYQHRLVFDLYPARPIDPLEVLIAERLAAPARAVASAAPAAPAAPTRPKGTAAKTAPAPVPTVTASMPDAFRQCPNCPCRCQFLCLQRPSPRRCWQPMHLHQTLRQRHRQRWPALLRPHPQSAKTAPPTASSSWRWTLAMAAKTPAPLAPKAHAKRTWC